MTTLVAEYHRTLDKLYEIWDEDKDRAIMMVLYFLADSQYGVADLKAMADLKYKEIRQNIKLADLSENVEEYSELDEHIDTYENLTSDDYKRLISIFSKDRLVGEKESLQLVMRHCRPDLEKKIGELTKILIDLIKSRSFQQGDCYFLL